MRPIFLLCLAAALAAATPAVRAAPALADGETLVYHVGWGILIGAGEIRITAKNAPPENGHPRLLVTTTTSTRTLARIFFKFDARSESLFDEETGRLLSTTETSTSDRKNTSDHVTFDYANSTAHYVNDLEPAKSKTIPMPPGQPLDLIMSLIQTRTWNLQPGEKRDALVIFDDEFYELTIHAEDYEEVRTPVGSFRTLALVPRMEKTPPKGMFKRGSSVRVWISQDDRRLPVKFQVDFKIGAGVATLVSYTPPTKEQPAGHP